MDRQFEKQFLLALNAIAKLTKTDLDPYLVSRYDAELREYGYEKVIEALNNLLSDISPNSRMPTIKQIKAQLGDIECSAEEEARETIDKIKYAVGRWGEPNSGSALDYIGELGRHLVQNMGGWESVCSFETYEALNMALAQAREYAKVAVKKKNAGYQYRDTIENGKITSLVDRLVEKTALVPSGTKK